MIQLPIAVACAMRRVHALFCFSLVIGARNPYCVVLVEREKVGETPVAAKTLAPVSSLHALNLSQRFVVWRCPVSVKASRTTTRRFASTIYIGICMQKSENQSLFVSIRGKEKVRQSVVEGCNMAHRYGVRWTLSSSPKCKGSIARGSPLLEAQHEIRNVVHHAVSFSTFPFSCHVMLVQVWNHSVAVPHESVRKAADTNVWPVPYQPLTIQASGFIGEGMSWFWVLYVSLYGIFPPPKSFHYDVFIFDSLHVSDNQENNNSRKKGNYTEKVLLKLANQRVYGHPLCCGVITPC